jgi:hypothetical protein
MKPLAARACARPLTAPSTMTLLEQVHHQLPDPPFSTERARSRSSAGYRPATLPLDSLVGSLAARPIASKSLRDSPLRRNASESFSTCPNRTPPRQRVTDALPEPAIATRHWGPYP